MVSVGMIDKLGQYFISITGPIQHLPITQLVLGGLNLLVATTAFLHSRSAYQVPQGRAGQGRAKNPHFSETPGNVSFW